MGRISLTPMLAVAAVFGLLYALSPATPVAAGGPSAHAYRQVGDHTLHLDAFPTGTSPAPAVVLVHGGGWRHGHRGWWSEIAQDISTEGWAAFSVDYRRSGEARFPAAVDDVRAAITWIRTNAVDLGVDAERVALLGGSAGGNLALLAATGPGAVAVTGVAVWSAPTDLAGLDASPRLRKLVTQWLACDLDACPERVAAASPLHQVDGHTPPVFLATGSEEFVPAAQAVALHDRLVELGVASQLVVIPGARHASAYRDEVWGDTIAFLRETFGT